MGAAAVRGCESCPSSSRSCARRWTCARVPRDDRDAGALARGASGVHNGRREATASGTNRLRIVAAAKAASPPASLHHPTRAARHPRPRTPPPRSSRRIHRYPSPLHPSSDNRPRVRATGTLAAPSSLPRACPLVSACTSLGTDVFGWKATTRGCLGDLCTDGPSDFRRTRCGPHKAPSTSGAAYLFRFRASASVNSFQGDCYSRHIPRDGLVSFSSLAAGYRPG